MKKWTLVFLLMIFVFPLFSNAIAEPEMRFNNIPWLSDEEVTIQTLINSGLLRAGTIPEFSDDNRLFFSENEMLGLTPTDYSKYKNVIVSCSISDSCKGKIAGYPVNNIKLTYAYDGAYQLISVNVDLKYAEYESILRKLKIVYGEPQFSENETGGIVSNIWIGDNNSEVILYTETGVDYVLIYRRTDVEEILSKCLSPVDPDDVSGL